MCFRAKTITSLVALFAVSCSSVAQASSAAERQVRVGGVAIGWPATGKGLITPGTQLAVRIRDNDAGQRVRFTLKRLDGRDRVVARATLRHGSFQPRVAHRVGARYALRVAVGQRRRESRFSVAAPPSTCIDRIDHGRPADAELRLEAMSAQAGDHISATFINSGEACLVSGLKLEWEARQRDGSFAPVPPLPSTLEAYTIPAGTLRTFTAWVYDTLSPGEYRAVLHATVGTRIFTFASGSLTVVP